MSNLVIPFDPAGLDPKVVNAFDDLIASVQTWAGRVTANHDITGSFTAVQPRCHLMFSAKSASITLQSIPNNTETDVLWPSLGGTVTETAYNLNDLSYDNGDQFGGKFISVANTAWIMPPVAGQYLVYAVVVFDANSTGYRHVVLYERTGGIASEVMAATGAAVAPVLWLPLSATVTMGGRDTGDALKLTVKQTSGGALDVLARTRIIVQKVS